MAGFTKSRASRGHPWLGSAVRSVLHTDLCQSGAGSGLHSVTIGWDWWPPHIAHSQKLQI